MILVLRALRRLSRSIQQWANTSVIRRSLRRAGVRSVEKIPTFTKGAELEALFALASSCPANAKAVEIGSYLGASACYLGAALVSKGGHLHCVDTWQNDTMPAGARDVFEEFRRNTVGLASIITPVRRRAETLSPDDLPGHVDLAFIDGNHAYDAVKRDFETVSRLLTRDGVIAFHDSNAFRGVSRVVGEALASEQWAIGGHVTNLCWLRRPAWTE